MEMRKFNYMLMIDILRNSSQNNLGVLRGAFYGFGCPKRHPDRPCWLKDHDVIKFIPFITCRYPGASESCCGIHRMILLASITVIILIKTSYELYLIYPVSGYMCLIYMMRLNFFLCGASAVMAYSVFVASTKIQGHRC